MKGANRSQTKNQSSQSQQKRPVNDPYKSNESKCEEQRETSPRQQKNGQGIKGSQAAAQKKTQSSTTQAIEEEQKDGNGQIFEEDAEVVPITAEYRIQDEEPINQQRNMEESKDQEDCGNENALNEAFETEEEEDEDDCPTTDQTNDIDTYEENMYEQDEDSDSVSQSTETSNDQANHANKKETRNEEQRKEAELSNELTNMLINLYNGKEPKELIQQYRQVIRLLQWRKMNFGLSYQSLQNLFTLKITDIIGQVKNRIYEDAKEKTLFITELKQIEKPVANADQAKLLQKEKPYVIKLTSYKDKKEEFDNVLSEFGDYFDLFKNGENKLEDLWLQILEYFQLPRPQNLIFSQIHYNVYHKHVICNPHLREVINEALKWNDTKEATDKLQYFLERIDDIKNKDLKKPDQKSYIQFIQSYERKYFYNKNLQQEVKPKTLQTQQHKCTQHCGDHAHTSQRRNAKRQNVQNAVNNKSNQKVNEYEVEEEDSCDEGEKLYNLDIDSLMQVLESTSGQKKGGKKGKNKKNKKQKAKTDYKDGNDINEEQQQQEQSESRIRSNSISQQQEEDFEIMIQSFKQKLESNLNRMAYQKLRPNYAKEWIEQLRCQLQDLSYQLGSAKASSEQSAVPCAGF